MRPRVMNAICERCGKPVVAVQTQDDSELYWIFNPDCDEGMEHECVQPRLIDGGIRGMQRYFLTDDDKWTIA